MTAIGTINIEWTPRSVTFCPVSFWKDRMCDVWGFSYGFHPNTLRFLDVVDRLNLTDGITWRTLEQDKRNDHDKA